jgi:hypothetical protein
LRAELEPKLEIAEKLFPKIMELISLFDDGYDSRDEQKIETAITAINSLTDKNIKAEDLFEYWGAESQEELAFKLSIPDPIMVDNITRCELLEIVNRIQSFDDNKISEKLTEFGVPLSNLLSNEYYLPLLKRNFSYPEPSELFDRQKINGTFIELTANEIVDKILSHRPIEL